MPITNLLRIKPYERVEYTLRRHPITFFPHVILLIILMLVPAAVYWLLGRTSSLLEGPVSLPLLILLASAYYLSIYLFFYSFFIEFYLDMWIITNDRLLDIKQVSLFARTIAEVDLYQIQDVTSEVRGFFPSVFSYGAVSLQTAGPVPKFILRNVPNPHHLRQEILELAAQDRRYHNK